MFQLSRPSENNSISERIKVVLAVGMLLGMSACASSADPAAMTFTPAAESNPFPEPLQQAMCVRDVTGGEETNPMWASKVDNEGFRTALASSLDGVGLSAPSESCSYPIDTNLLGLSQPVMGFDMTVTSHVNYKVYDQAGDPLLLATIDAPYTAAMSEAFVGAERLKKANEGSIRTSIEKFFERLREIVFD